MAVKLTRCEALRRLLADGRWHHMRELQEAGGYRYGARLWSNRQRGFDHEVKRDPKTGAYLYRRTP